MTHNNNYRPDFHSESEMITVSANDKTLVEMLRMPEDRCVAFVMGRSGVRCSVGTRMRACMYVNR